MQNGKMSMIKCFDRRLSSSPLLLFLYSFFSSPGLFYVLCSTGVNGLKSAIVTGVDETLDIMEGKMRQGAEFLDDALRLSQSINSDVNLVLVSLNGI
mmetsp:Transcript_4119/g.9607  ORF Transcript_4119/g.9607 Transcript_4119/m.9607 type:complete len:97 (+) Transcript_4119:745-1035(+)